MDAAFDIPDSTDWLNTPLAAVSSLENALHCQICKEFYDTPMITSCAHTFCSKCIRTSLSTDGRCPACRATDQASKLRNNWALQEVVSTFLAARPAALEVARREVQLHTTAKTPGKRKRVNGDVGDATQNGEEDGRTTRSKTRRINASQTSQPETVEMDDSDTEIDSSNDVGPDDGLVECPLGCGKRMKIEAVEPHLDRCEEEKAQASRSQSRTPNNIPSSSFSRPPASNKPQDRISELNYSLLNETKLRKKMDELGLPGWGAKPLLIKRHTAWVNLWNANCDSSHPRKKRELLHELDTWERTQGGKAPTSSGAIMKKDFDGSGWADRNKDDFSRLIAEAKRKKGIPVDKAEGKDVELPADNLNTPEKDPVSVDGSNDSETKQGLTNPHNPVTEDNQTTPDVKNGDDAMHPPPSSQIPPNHEPFPQTAQEPCSVKRETSRDEHRGNVGSGTPCDLPAHLHTPAVRKVPMFTVPRAAVTDVDLGGPGEGSK